MKIRKVPTLIAASLLASAGTAWARNPAQVETKAPLGANVPFEVKTPLEAKAPLNEKFALSGVRIGEHTADVIAANGFPTHLLLSSGNANPTTLQVPFQKATILKADVLPDWASAVSPPLNDNRVLWLYNRGNYALAFGVDSLGMVDAVIVAGVSPTRTEATRLQNGKNAVDLGTDLRKIIFLYNYPDSITSYKSETSEFRDFTLNYQPFVATVRDNRVVRLQLNAPSPTK